MNVTAISPAPHFSADRPHARQSSKWLTHGVMYQIYLRSFTPEGTLKAATARLEKVRALGVDVLYLCPICVQDDDTRREFWSPRQRKFDNPCNPYRIKDYYQLDPEYGTDDDLRQFVNEAHRLGMRLLLDIVFLHCGPTAVFLKDHPEFIQRNPDGTARMGNWAFPLLNFEFLTLREYLWRNLEYWIREFNVDGYRCDVSDAVPLDFWEESRRRIEKLKPDVVMLAEGHRIEDSLFAFDVNYCFPWGYGLHAVFNGLRPASSLRDVWTDMEGKRPKGSRFIRYIDNHDLAHDMSYGLLRSPETTDEAWAKHVQARGIPETGLPPDRRPDRAWGNPAVNAALVLNFSLDGIPFLYNGQEVSDTAAHSLYGKVPIHWPERHSPAIAARYTLCQNLVALRHAEPVLSEGSLRWLDTANPQSLLAFVRETVDEQALVFVNLSNQQATVPWPLENHASFKACLETGITLSADTITLEPFGYWIGLLKR